MVKKKPLEEIITDLIELFKPYLKDIHSVLDIGTGTSLPAHVFAQNFPGIRFFTIDVADIRKKKELPFIIYNGRKLPYDNHEFDASILNETLHHCDDPESVLTEAARVSGSVYLIEHFPNQGITVSELYESEMKALADFGIECKIYKPFTEHSLNLLIDKSGLMVQDKFEIPYHGVRKIRKYFFKLKSMIDNTVRKSGIG